MYELWFEIQIYYELAILHDIGSNKEGPPLFDYHPRVLEGPSNGIGLRLQSACQAQQYPEAFPPLL